MHKCVLLTLMESMLLCLHSGKGAVRDKGGVAKRKVYISQCALADAEGGHHSLFCPSGVRAAAQRSGH